MIGLWLKTLKDVFNVEPGHPRSETPSNEPRTQLHQERGAWLLLLATLLNLIPGFGLGYLVVGKRRALWKSLLGWAIPGFVAIFSYFAIETGLLCDPEPLYGCVEWALLFMAGLTLGFLAVNLPGAIHLFIIFVKRLFLLSRGRQTQRPATVGKHRPGG